ncbi:hypothetical protein [Merdibacter massiliensis]|uniref:hypothetical protein n=1 Tax=Merdibacter massiliensis TaxID=1871030 RepID=UPI00096A7F58|nr:hypothetical protein [Merdibacter massiliensis]
MTGSKRKKRTKKVHIDNLHLVKRLEPEYMQAFFDFEEVLVKEAMDEAKINVIANLAIEQLQEGMAKKKKPSLIINKEKHYQTYIAKMSRGAMFQQMKEKLKQQDYEKLTISGIWLVFSVCLLLLFFKNLITETYLINFSIDLIAAAVAAVLAVRNYQVRWHIIKQSEKKSFYLGMDIITLALCVVVKVFAQGNFDVSYLLLVISYFVSKQRYRKDMKK